MWDNDCKFGQMQFMAQGFGVRMLCIVCKTLIKWKTSTKMIVPCATGMGLPELNDVVTITADCVCVAVTVVHASAKLLVLAPRPSETLFSLNATLHTNLMS